MNRHHPSEATLLAHVAGSLPAAHRQVIALHIAYCSLCAADAHLLEETAGGLLDRLPPAPLADNGLARILARLGEPPPAPRPVVLPPGSPAGALGALATGRWRWAGPGIAIMPLMARDETDTRLDLIRVAPGTGLLEHGHDGLESTIVLQGAFDDRIARYEVGDFAEAEGGVDHRPTARPGPDCICLIATTAHLQAHSFVGRLVRPWLGM